MQKPSHSGLKRGCATVPVLSEWSASRGETVPVSLNPSRVGPRARQHTGAMAAPVPPQLVARP